jgi:mannose-6-phosphate isomerase
VSILDHIIFSRSWLFSFALPIWFNRGLDLHRGGFYERLNLDCSPHDIVRRTRVPARQVYSYVTAREIGYQGDIDPVIDQGLAWLSGPARNPQTGLLYGGISPDRVVVKPEVDIYDLAFELLSCAAVHGLRPNNTDTLDRALFVRKRLLNYYRHPYRGFEEAQLRVLPLRANPHMHLLEACLAWMEAGGDLIWCEIAADITALAMGKFIDPNTGAVREFFDGDWNPIEGDAGRIVEPGHLFEWGWLLVRWFEHTRDPAFVAAARRMIALGEQYGVDPHRNVAINELWDDLSPKDQCARLWPQTERIKAHVALARVADTDAERKRHLELTERACEGLKPYLDVPTPGLYRDRMNADGSFVEESAPASTLYHLVCAIRELTALAGESKTAA